jgi:hypothetical protein
MPFRVASFNLQNLNAAGHAFVGRRDLPYAAAALDEKQHAIAAVLDRAAADIVGFQEVFSETALRDAVRRSIAMADAQVWAPHAAPIPDPLAADGRPLLSPWGEPVSDGPFVGLASRLPLARPPVSIADFPAGVTVTVPSGLHDAVETIHHLGLRRFERPVLRAEPMVEGLPGLVVLVAHLKSKLGKVLPGEDPDDPVVQALGSLRSLIVRAAEAAALKALVVQARNEWEGARRRPVIVLGDLNDGMRAVTTSMIVGPRPWAGPGKRADRLGFARRAETLMLPAIDLTPPGPEVPGGPVLAHTHVHDGVGEVLDMILVSADFAPIEGHARARVTATVILDTGGPAALPAPVLPEPEPFVPEALPDPLLPGPPEDRRRSPKPGFDHNVPVAEIAVLS